jgi:hypothetical protein
MITPAYSTAYHPLAILLLAPFITVFAWAGWVELRRWSRGAPAPDRRNRFEIDESAPGYEPPPERAATPRIRP